MLSRPASTAQSLRLKGVNPSPLFYSFPDIHGSRPTPSRVLYFLNLYSGSCKPLTPQVHANPSPLTLTTPLHPLMPLRAPVPLSLCQHRTTYLTATLFRAGRVSWVEHVKTTLFFKKYNFFLKQKLGFGV
jgi:hypothetical protein